RSTSRWKSKPKSRSTESTVCNEFWRKRMKKKPLYKHLYVQVLFAIACGVVLGHFWPDTGAAMKPLGDAFIQLIKMIIAPIICCTVVGGIAGMEDMKKIGRVGGKALLSTLALIIG